MSANLTLNPFQGLPDINVVEPFSDKDQPLINDVFEVLKKHQAVDRFGLTLLHNHFDVKNGETLLETCDTKNRRLMLQPYKAGDLPKGDFMQTTWRFDDVANFYCLQICDTSNGHGVNHFPLFDPPGGGGQDS